MGMLGGGDYSFSFSEASDLVDSIVKEKDKKIHELEEQIKNLTGQCSPHIVGDIMFEVTVKVMGKPAQVLEVSEGATIAQAQELMGLEGNYTFNLGGKPATKDTVLSEGAYVVLAPSVKGASK